MNNFEEIDTDTDTDIEEEDGKPQPYAGFKRRFLSTSTKRKFDWDQNEAVFPGMRKSVSAPPLLAPMAEPGESSGDQEYEGGSSGTFRPWVYFPANVDIEVLVDWKQMTEENNNHMMDDMMASRDKAALVNINNKEVAVFRYGQQVIATSSRCPHAGGPLHQGDIEVLPDRSLCVRCPWHKWAFRVNQAKGCQERSDIIGDCVFPPGRDDKKLQIFPTKVDRKRSQIKIGFQSFDEKMLINETF